jgi:hypothetical protein
LQTAEAAIPVWAHCQEPEIRHVSINRRALTISSAIRFGFRDSWN